MEQNLNIWIIKKTKILFSPTLRTSATISISKSVSTFVCLHQLSLRSSQLKKDARNEQTDGFQQLHVGIRPMLVELTGVIRNIYTMSKMLRVFNKIAKQNLQPTE